MRRRHAAVAVCLLAALTAGAGVGASGPGSGHAVPGVETTGVGDDPAPDQLVTPEVGDSYVWPYTSRSRSVSGRTLALNVVVDAHPDRVRRLLTNRTAANWSAEEPGQVTPWRPAHGSVRYTYVAPTRNATGEWVGADYQLHVGRYLGARTHVRAYDAPDGDWTALQAHTEYWDWFRLRHTVTGVAAGARFVEDDLGDEPVVATITRSEHGQSGGGSDGSWTVVELVPAALLMGIPLVGAALPVSGRLSGRSRAVALPVALAGLVVGVRIAGIAAETVVPGVTPKLFAALGYTALVVGPPALVATFARDDDPLIGSPAAFALLATAGLAVGLVAELVIVGVRLPTRLIDHRVALALALGLFAFGVDRSDRRIVAVGVTAWLLTLAVALFGYA